MRRAQHLPTRFWSKVDRSDGCWLWRGALNSTNYGLFNVNHRSRLAHRVAWTLTYGPIPPGLCVCHHCDESRCVRPDHLFVGTHADNQSDKCRKRRQCRHESRPLAKLTMVAATEMRARYQLGQITQAQLARSYGIDPSTVSRIMHNLKWKVD